MVQKYYDVFTDREHVSYDVFSDMNETQIDVQTKETRLIKPEVILTIKDTTFVSPNKEYEGETAVALVAFGDDRPDDGTVILRQSEDNGLTWSDVWSVAASDIGSDGYEKYIIMGWYLGTSDSKSIFRAEYLTERGYLRSKSNTESVFTVSSAISWKNNGNTGLSGIGENALTIYDSDRHIVEEMVPGNVYYLELPRIYALNEIQSAPLHVNRDYSIVWQYRDVYGVWVDYVSIAAQHTVKVTASFSQYVFRAVVKPIVTSHYKWAAGYDSNINLLTPPAYTKYTAQLVSKTTEKTA